MPRNPARKDIRKEVWLTRAQLRFIKKYCCLENESIKACIEKIVGNHIVHVKKMVLKTTL